MQQEAIEDEEICKDMTPQERGEYAKTKMEKYLKDLDIKGRNKYAR